MFAMRLPWVSITPLGSLVDPDENWMNAKSSGARPDESCPARDMSVMDSTRKQRDLRSSKSSVSPTSGASAARRSRFLASVYSSGLPILRATRSSLWRCSSLMPTASGTGTIPPHSAGPESVEKLLVVVQENDHLVAALRAHAPAGGAGSPVRARGCRRSSRGAPSSRRRYSVDRTIDGAVVFQDARPKSYASSCLLPSSLGWSAGAD